MTIHQIRGRLVHTSHDYPPTPDRGFDWSAVEDDYDVDFDQDGYFSTCPHGYGATEQDAIDDLLEQLEDRGDIPPLSDWNGIVPRFLKTAATLVAIVLACACIFVWSVLFVDLDPPVGEPPCKKGSIVAYLDPCEVVP